MSKIKVTIIKKKRLVEMSKIKVTNIKKLTEMSNIKVTDIKHWLKCMVLW